MQKKKEPNPDLVPFCPANSSASECDFYSFSDSLSSGSEIDKFKLSELTAGKKFYAYIDNDIPGNQCNPNTYLNVYNNSGYSSAGDDNSSLLGNGFASALVGTV